MAEKYYKDGLIAGAAVRDANGKRINTTYATKEELSNISVDGITNKNTGETLHYWVGTKAEYEAQNIETEHPDWIATITDDTTSGSGGGISEEQVTEILAPVNEAIETVNESVTTLTTQVESKASIEDFYEAQVVIDTFVDGTSGYRIWSDGYCEQWGTLPNDNTYTTQTVNFLKKFADTNYTLLSGGVTSVVDDYTSTANCGVRTAIYFAGAFYNKTTSSFVATKKGPTNWKACGYLADGEY